jgi:shikimate kinase
MKEQRIVIVGFMGCGKTMVAQELGLALNLTWVDLDELIQKHEQRTPAEIIEQEGEGKFRERETWMLRRVLSTEGERVVALGGGAWITPENRRLIAEHRALAVWLDAPFDLCWKRIEAGVEQRPLAYSREVALKLYDERRPVYKLANVRIKITEHQSSADIASEIAREIVSSACGPEK